MEKFNVFDCSIIELDKHHSDRKGNLTVVQNGDTLPFDVKRVYYLYDVPGGEERGAHAHKELSQLIIAASGSFTITLDDGKCKRSLRSIVPTMDYTSPKDYGALWTISPLILLLLNLQIQNIIVRII